VAGGRRREHLRHQADFAAGHSPDFLNELAAQDTGWQHRRGELRPTHESGHPCDRAVTDASAPSPPFPSPEDAVPRRPHR
jgi:hypothetical protein